MAEEKRNIVMKPKVVDFTKLSDEKLKVALTVLLNKVLVDPETEKRLSEHGLTYCIKTVEVKDEQR